MMNLKKKKNSRVEPRNEVGESACVHAPEACE